MVSRKKGYVTLQKDGLPRPKRLFHGGRDASAASTASGTNTRSPVSTNASA